MRRERTWRRTVAALVLTLAVAGCGADGPRARPTLGTADASSPADFEFVIPEGTGDRLSAGEQVAILPARIDAEVGQTIRLVNQDRWGFAAGPFYVGAHETLTQTFVSEGRYEGACNLHPDGKLVVDVEG